MTPGDVTILTTRNDITSTGLSLSYVNGKLELIFATESENVAMKYNMYPAIVHLLITFDNKKYKNQTLGRNSFDSDEFVCVYMNYNKIKPQSVEITKAKHESDQSKLIRIGGVDATWKNDQHKDKKANIGEFTIEHLLVWENGLDQAHIASFFEELNTA